MENDRIPMMDGHPDNHVIWVGGGFRLPAGTVFDGATRKMSATEAMAHEHDWEYRKKEKR